MHTVAVAIAGVLDLPVHSGFAWPPLIVKWGNELKRASQRAQSNLIDCTWKHGLGPTQHPDRTCSTSLPSTFPNSSHH